ncbi:hypothetical protein Sm713_64870 [Streptomyces sp. TS71-3]|nr:hypothetical protein Sm713_64870 [Streptomyces sp. TS71-3]
MSFPKLRGVLAFSQADWRGVHLAQSASLHSAGGTQRSAERRLTRASFRRLRQVTAHAAGTAANLRPGSLAAVPGYCSPVGSNRSEIELMQYRWSVGVG